MTMQTINETEPHPPRLIREVEATPGVRAVQSVPSDLRIEVCRIWDGKEAQSSITFETPGTAGGPLVVTVPANLADREAPGMVSEQVPAGVAKGMGIADALEGFCPAFLGMGYKPNFAARPRPMGLKRIQVPVEPAAIFAPDTRQVFRDTKYPWSTIGRVETAGGVGTGTMIGKRLVLTCSHVIDWTASGPGWLKFTPAYYDGQAPFGVAWGQTTLWWQKVTGSDGVSDFETAFDFVVVVLDRNLGDATGWAGYRTYSSSWNGSEYWQQIGYPGDMTNTQRPVYTKNGAVTSVGEFQSNGRKGFVLGHFIDITPGHSGGPLWAWWGNETYPSVVGVQSTSPRTPGSDTSGDNEAGGGPAMSDLIAYARQQYP